MMIDHQGSGPSPPSFAKQRDDFEAGWPDVNFHVGANWRLQALVLGLLVGTFAISFLVLVFFARACLATGAAPVSGCSLAARSAQSAC
jgi:hypothetical protein